MLCHLEISKSSTPEDQVLTWSTRPTTVRSFFSRSFSLEQIMVAQSIASNDLMSFRNYNVEPLLHLTYLAKRVLSY